MARIAYLNDLNKELSELMDAARRAGSIVNERIDEIIGAAERRADEIRRNAERDAEETRRTAEREAEEIRLRAEQEAETSRREALNSADRVFERISSLERPLTDLVGTLRFEADKVGRELGGHVDAHATAIAAESESHSTNAAEGQAPTRAKPPAAPADEAAGTEEPDVVIPDALPDDPRDVHGEDVLEEPTATQATASDTGPVRPEPPAEAPDTGPQPPTRAPEGPPPGSTQDQPVEPAPWSRETPTPASVEPSGASVKPDDASVKPEEPAAKGPLPFTVSTPAPEEKRGLLSRLRPGGSKRVFIDTPGHCAVCQKSFQADSEAELAASGWRVSGDIGLCPEDQADGWQLPEGAKLPFRRGGN